MSREALLQQGSILLGEAHVRLVEFVPVADRARLRRELGEAAAVAGPWLGADRSLARLADALAALLPGARRGVPELESGQRAERPQ